MQSCKLFFANLFSGSSIKTLLNDFIAVEKSSFLIEKNPRVNQAFLLFGFNEIEIDICFFE